MDTVKLPESQRLLSVVLGLDAVFTPLPGEHTFREADTASLDELLRRMDAQEFDLVAVGRALIANPSIG